MTQLRKMMLEELQRRNSSNGTIRHHLRAVEEFAKHYSKVPDQLGLNALRSYQAYLLKASTCSRLASRNIDGPPLASPYDDPQETAYASVITKS